MTPNGLNRSLGKPDRPSVRERARAAARELVARVAKVLFTLIVFVFIVATIVGRGKAALGCLGILPKKADTSKIEVRDLDLSRQDDARFAASLARMTDAAGIPSVNVKAKVVGSDIVNAAALGDSSFLLVEGLKAVPDGALDAIMAHEAAHAVKQHVRSRGRVSAFVSVVTHVVGFFVGAGGEARDEAAGWATGVTVPTYSKQQELEADSVAVELLNKAGYGGDGAAVMQSTLKMLESQHGPSGGGFLDHPPALSERVQRLQPPTGIVERDPVPDVEAQHGET